MDVNPDFEKFTFEELLQAERGINKDKYPDRYKIITNLLSSTKFDEAKKASAEYFETKLKYSTFWLRCFAAIIDGLLLMLLIFLECKLLGVEYSSHDKYLQSINAFQLVMYYILMHGVYGQTLGKMVMGVKVVNNSNEQPIEIFQAIRRESVALIISISSLLFNVLYSSNNNELDSLLISTIFIVSLFYTLWVIAEFITMLFNKKRRAVHDFIGKTVVIRI